MRKSRFTDEQMVKMLREADRTSVAEVAKKHGVSEQTVYLWRKRFGGMDADDVQRVFVAADTKPSRGLIRNLRAWSHTMDATSPRTKRMRKSTLMNRGAKAGRRPGRRKLERLARSLVVLGLCCMLTSCTKSLTNTDAMVPVDASDGGDASTDAGIDSEVDFDAAGLACYPVTFDYVLQNSTGFWLYVGLHLNCDDFGFVATNAELSTAEGLGATCTLHATDEYWCALPVPGSWTVAGSDYDDICVIESTLGPRRWICVYSG